MSQYILIQDQLNKSMITQEQLNYLFSLIDSIFGEGKNACQIIQVFFNCSMKDFSEINDDELEQFDDALKIKTGWGQLYDIEQLTEHAIVHILRHRRQIEKFKIILSGLI